MRLRKLDLLAYGKFTSQPIGFPPTSPDFHFILGPNEAGKSTIRDAIADVLFGIGTQSPYNFLHPYPNMRLAATIEQGENRVEFQRAKRNRQPLRDAADKPISDDLLVAFLGGADRAFFERMFGLDHRRLGEGGAEILQAKDDVGHMLFESAAGLSGFGKFRDQLEQEADQLFTKRHSANRAFYEAQDRLEKAEHTLREATIRTSDWKERQRVLTSAQDALEHATTEVKALAVERTKLERVRRVAGELRVLAGARQERESLEAVILLPVDATQVLDQVEQAIALADYERQRLESEIAAINKRLNESPIDEKTLPFKVEIEKLTEARNFVHKHDADIQKQKAMAADRCRTLEQDAQQLNWLGSDIEVLSAQLPMATARAEIRALIERSGALVAAAKLAQQAVEAQTLDIEDDQKALAATKEIVIPASLQSALNSARTLAESESQLAEFDRQVSLEERRLAQGLAALKPWSGDVGELRALLVVDANAVRDIRDRARDIEEKRRAYEENIQELREELAEHKATAAKIEKEQHPVTSDAVENARSERDSLWTRVREGEITPKGASAKYEGAVQKADDLVDRRYVGASGVTKLESAKSESTRTQKKIDQHEKSISKLDSDSEKLQLDWKKSMSVLGMESMKTNVYPGWLDRREAALLAAEKREAVESQRASLLQRVQKAQKALRVAMTAIDTVKVNDSAKSSLAEIIEQAEEAVDNANAAISKRQQLVESLRQARARQPRLNADLKTANDELATWQKSWNRNLSAVKLDSTMSVDAASVALELISRIESTIREIRQINVDRIESMQRDLDAFERSARELAGHLALEIREDAPQDISRHLEERIRKTELAARDYAHEQTALNSAAAALAKAIENRLTADATLAPLLNQTNAKSTGELRIAIERSEKRRQLEDQIESLECILADKGDGLSAADLDKEVANEDLATVAARLSTIEADRATAAERRDAYIREVAAAQQNIDQIDGQQHAADAEAQRQEALADMSDVVRRYVKVKTAARLLRWGVDRYAEQKQGPLLASATGYFRALTCNSFDSLIVDFEKQPPELLGKRKNGELVPVNGMSEGTRDPLYLSLRLAAVNLHLATAQALPFIADDLFMSFDDDRARAGFEGLGELATRTQVIYLSHHAHLVPIARQVFGDKMSVTEIHS